MAINGGFEWREREGETGGGEEASTVSGSGVTVGLHGRRGGAVAGRLVRRRTARGPGGCGWGGEVERREKGAGGAHLQVRRGEGEGGWLAGWAQIGRLS
jgi:hypothetical protein